MDQLHFQIISLELTETKHGNRKNEPINAELPEHAKKRHHTDDEEQKSLVMGMGFGEEQLREAKEKPTPPTPKAKSTSKHQKR